MKKIGTTSSGIVIVEMTSKEFEALAQLQEPSNASSAAERLSATEKLAYVRERILKLSPKKKEGVAHSISTMFRLQGGISDSDIEEIIVGLQKEKFLTIDESGRVTYKKA